MSERSAVTRRRLLAASTAAVALPTVVSAASGSDAATQQESFRLESHVNGWEGVAPDAIAGERNPTLRLTEGEEYEIVWENVDGVSHNLLVRNQSGERVAETETVGTEGETRSVTFTATADLSGYRCGIHPSTMDGDIAFGEAETTEETMTETATETTTATAEETTAVTETPEDGDGTDGGDGDADGSDGGGQHGFGLLAAVAGLLGGLSLRRRRD